MYEKLAIHRVEAMKDSMNQLSQRGVEQLGTVKYNSRQRGQASSHLSLLHTPAAKRQSKDRSQDWEVELSRPLDLQRLFFLQIDFKTCQYFAF